MALASAALDARHEDGSSDAARRGWTRARMFLAEAAAPFFHDWQSALSCVEAKADTRTSAA